MTTSEQIDWRKDFEKQFAVEWHDWGADFAWADDADAKGSQIMQFIQDLLTQERQRVIELVENMPDLEEPMEIYPDGSMITKNTGLVRKSDIISALKKGNDETK